MLGFFRKLAGTWPARIFFAALAAAFVGWGISSKVNLTGGGDGSTVATVEGKSISAGSFQVAFREDMQRIAQRYPDPTQIPPELREEAAQETLEKLVTQQALDNVAHSMGVSAPETAVQDDIRAVPAFQGMDGKFDHNTYLQVLSQHNLTPQMFQDDIRKDVAKNQILNAVIAGAQPNDLLTNLVYQYLNEQRTANLVRFTFAGDTPPPPPADSVLQRYADNNVRRYTSPEYRRVSIVILSPETIGRTLNLSDADLRAWYEAHRSEFEAPEKRSLQVITVSGAGAAQTLAASWRAGASWSAMQDAARQDKASAIELNDTTKAGIPTPELANAAFTAPDGSIIGPIEEPLGYQVARITNVTPARNPSFEDLKDTIRKRLGAERGADLVDERAQKLQDLFAGGSRIDEVPADIGAAGVQGTLDAKGNTQESVPAPIPAPQDARQLIVADAFKTPKGETTQLTEGPNHVWYALAVQDIIKPAVKPFQDIRAEVLRDWQNEQIRHATETEAARMLGIIRGGQPIATAAWGSGHQVVRTPPLFRNRQNKGVSAQLTQLIFSLKKGEPTMVETAEGFVVGELADIVRPDPKADQAAVSEVKSGLGQALADDLLVSYGTAVRDAGHPSVNAKLVQQLTQSPGE